MRGNEKRCYALGFILFLAVGSAIAKPGASELLDEIISVPGAWSQMCGMIAPDLSGDVPIPLYSLAAPLHYSLSQQNIHRLRERRGEVVAEVVSRLSQIDLSKSPKVRPHASGAYSLDKSSQDPRYLTELMLQIIQELKIVEALPHLLRLEFDLAAHLKEAESNKNVALPPLDLDPARGLVGSGASKVYVARVYQSELLGLMAGLLREVRFEPLLQSKIEAKYYDSLKRQAKSPGLVQIKGPTDIPKEQEVWISFDSVHNIPKVTQFRASSEFSIPKTPEVRLEIRQYVENYLKSISLKGAAESAPQQK
jgi:hypothetical protein